VAVDSQGRIIVAGLTRTGFEPDSLGPDFAVVRLTPTGKLDTSFGRDGVQTIDFSVDDIQSDDAAYGVAIAAGDSVIVVGNSLVSTVGSKVAMAKLTNTGVLDPTFDTGGKLTFTYVTGGIATAEAGVAIDPTNQGIIVGGLSGPSPFKFGVARLTPTGGFDATFTGGGRTTFAIATDSTTDVPFDLTLDSAGRIVMAGFSQITGSQRIAVARLTSTGGFDGTFDTDGKTAFNFTGSTVDAAQAVDTDAANNIYLAGYTLSGGSLTQLVAKLTSGGVPDSGFGTGGFFTPGAIGIAQGIGVQLDGKVVVAAPFFLSGGATDFDIFRLDKIGKLDTTFNPTGATPGRNVFDLGANQSDQPTELVLDPNGRILVVGSNNTTPGIEVARLEGNQVGLQVTLSDGETLIRRGQTLTYTLVVSNTGPDAAVGARLSTTPGGNFFGATFTVTSTADPGVTGNTAAGNALPNDTLTLPAGTKVTYTITATLPVTATGTVTLTSAVSVPTGVLDPNTGNNTATDTNTIRQPPPRLAVGTEAGVAAQVRLFDATSGALALAREPFPGFTGGITVASGDVTGDGTLDLIVGAGPGAPNGHVKVFDGATGGELLSYFAFPGFRGGVNVAAGDLNGDGRAEILVGAGPGAPGGHVKVFSSASGVELFSFFAYGGGFLGGASVAAGDVDGDRIADIVTGSGAGAPSGHVKAFSGRTGAELLSFFAYPGFNGGVRVSAGDLDGNGRAEVVTGTFGAAPHVKAFGSFGQELASFFAFDPARTTTVDVAVVDVSGDGRGDVVAATRLGAVPELRAFRGPDFAAIDDPYSLDILGGIEIG
jgi:uncharacterized delta-60 repeat protein/uncharacterized repeat protein (TIGR01451 family)